jgi:hypothetical protein
MNLLRLAMPHFRKKGRLPLFHRARKIERLFCQPRAQSKSKRCRLHNTNPTTWLSRRRQDTPLEPPELRRRFFVLGGIAVRSSSKGLGDRSRLYKYASGLGVGENS